MPASDNNDNSQSQGTRGGVHVAYTEDLKLSLAEYSLFGSILTFGAMIRAIKSGPITDFVGCKGMSWISSILCSAGWPAMYFAEFMITAAVSLSFVIGTMITWRVLALIGLAPFVVLVTGLSFIPESPRWLVKTGNHQEFYRKCRTGYKDTKYSKV
ncbi:sugar transporter ERD6-like 7 [Artemisia annua]|uniref:Sugar transporter ERD6-like 7 n=1 Tax=Artemisia annua TaxID=35608 RepID=A0A2U1MX64_ARTAN|nr:sugar transporter ERD6-like 7 [Artemisia annua]